MTNFACGASVFERPRKIFNSESIKVWGFPIYQLDRRAVYRTNAPNPRHDKAGNCRLFSSVQNHPVILLIVVPVILYPMFIIVIWDSNTLLDRFFLFLFRSISL